MRIPLAAIACLVASSPAAGAERFARPPVIRFGATTAQMEAALDGQCTKRVTRPISPPFLGGVKRRQLQIDCDGFRFMGKPRWAEFVIRDDRLEMVWIMVDATEQAVLVEAMRKAYGAPGKVTGRYIAFPRARAAWRFKPAEILFYSPLLAAQVEPWFAE